MSIDRVTALIVTVSVLRFAIGVSVRPAGEREPARSDRESSGGCRSSTSRRCRAGGLTTRFNSRRSASGFPDPVLVREGSPTPKSRWAGEAQRAPARMARRASLSRSPCVAARAGGGDVTSQRSRQSLPAASRRRRRELGFDRSGERISAVRTRKVVACACACAWACAECVEWLDPGKVADYLPSWSRRKHRRSSPLTDVRAAGLRVGAFASGVWTGLPASGTLAGDALRATPDRRSQWPLDRRGPRGGRDRVNLGGVAPRRGGRRRRRRLSCLRQSPRSRQTIRRTPASHWR
jgi:hypothetical protein